jgi:hypothetical protein
MAHGNSGVDHWSLWLGGLEMSRNDDGTTTPSWPQTLTSRDSTVCSPGCATLAP